MRRLASSVIALLLSACAQIPPVEVPMPSPMQSEAVVVDIDGTLTPQVTSLFKARPGAAQALSAFAAKGYKIVYLTARSPFFQAGLSKWLQRNGFPRGSLHVAQTHEERSHVEKFKARILNDYIQSGWHLAYAYGDSSTDFRAYAIAGIPRERVFGLRRQGARTCQSGGYRLCLDGWTDQIPFIEREVPSAK